jgi:hypothetical protein
MKTVVTLISFLLVVGLGACSGTAPGRSQRSAPPLTVLPDPGVQGQVVTANPQLRYVVMDFPIRRLPALEQLLNVYRDGQKVGEVRVTGPLIGTATAGDILTGQALPGDEVRED